MYNYPEPSNSINKFQKRTKWIWHNDRKLKNCGNIYVYFHKTFKLSKTYKIPSISVSADGSFNLYLNEYLLGRGPTKSLHWRQYISKFEIPKKFLNKGFNCLLALVHTNEESNAWYLPPVCKVFKL